MRLVKIIVKLLILFLLVLFMSCSSQWHLRRAIKKDPSAFDTTRVVQLDTVIVPIESVDTVFKLQRDTLIEYLQNDVQIKYRYSTITDTLMIEVDCPDNEVVTKTVTETVPIIIQPTIWDSLKLLFKYWWVIVLAVVSIFLLKKLV